MKRSNYPALKIYSIEFTVRYGKPVYGTVNRYRKVVQPYRVVLYVQCAYPTYGYW